MNNNLSRYDDMPANKAVLKNALPAIVATLMQLVYNLAYTFFSLPQTCCR
jgi:Na+-driven multidrug efflux pump